MLCDCTILHMEILTHRGLRPSRTSYFTESSFEAFEDQLKDGFGIEFDPVFLADGQVGVLHAGTVGQVLQNSDETQIEKLTLSDFTALSVKSGRLSTLDELLALIEIHKAPLCALHFKGKHQSEEHTKLLIEALRRHPNVIPLLLIFDLKPFTAALLRAAFPEIVLAPSVAHPYDIERFNDCVYGTLMSTEEAVAQRQLFDWVWLDEWDLNDEMQTAKKFYTTQTFALFREQGFKIAVVTPELHGTSPGLLGGEAHPDATSKEILFTRIQEILDLRPDAVCTDYPDEVRELSLTP